MSAVPARSEDDKVPNGDLPASQEPFPTPLKGVPGPSVFRKDRPYNGIPVDQPDKKDRASRAPSQFLRLCFFELFCSADVPRTSLLGCTPPRAGSA